MTRNGPSEGAIAALGARSALGVDSQFGSRDSFDGLMRLRLSRQVSIPKDGVQSTRSGACQLHARYPGAVGRRLLNIKECILIPLTACPSMEYLLNREPNHGR